MKSVSWNQITEDIRSMWRVYWSISDPTVKEQCRRAIHTVTDSMIRMHGMIDEEVVNRS